MTASSPGYATPVMDVQLDTLISQIEDLKDALNLTPNQQILWRQIETKARAITNERRSRREDLQSALKKNLKDPNTELRNLEKNFSTEVDLSHQENKQLRELFLSMNDSLDDNQRRKILSLLSDQLDRMPDQGGDSKSCDQPKSRGMGRQRPGNPSGSQQ
jgi:chromatin segregation and condensation protein Rec8/ScpA/Scc1 (kleisin family)